MKLMVLAIVAAAMPASGAQIGGICTIRQIESRIQGPCKNQAGETVLNGEVNGNNVTWKYEAKYEGATVVLVFKGVLESDSEIKGTITASDTDGNNTTTGVFSAKRQ
jgi:hypothetical protein